MQDLLIHFPSELCPICRRKGAKCTFLSNSIPRVEKWLGKKGEKRFIDDFLNESFDPETYQIATLICSKEPHQK